MWLEPLYLASKKKLYTLLCFFCNFVLVKQMKTFLKDSLSTLDFDVTLINDDRFAVGTVISFANSWLTVSQRIYLSSNSEKLLEGINPTNFKCSLNAFLTIGRSENDLLVGFNCCSLNRHGENSNNKAIHHRKTSCWNLKTILSEMRHIEKRLNLWAGLHFNNETEKDVTTKNRVDAADRSFIQRISVRMYHTTHLGLQSKLHYPIYFWENQSCSALNYKSVFLREEQIHKVK